MASGGTPVDRLPTNTNLRSGIARTGERVRTVGCAERERFREGTQAGTQPAVLREGDRRDGVPAVGATLRCVHPRRGGPAGRCVHGFDLRPGGEQDRPHPRRPGPGDRRVREVQRAASPRHPRGRLRGRGGPGDRHPRPGARARPRSCRRSCGSAATTPSSPRRAGWASWTRWSTSPRRCSPGARTSATPIRTGRWAGASRSSTACWRAGSGSAAPRRPPAKVTGADHLRPLPDGHCVRRPARHRLSAPARGGRARRPEIPDARRASGVPACRGGGAAAAGQERCSGRHGAGRGGRC